MPLNAPLAPYEPPGLQIHIGIDSLFVSKSLDRFPTCLLRNNEVLFVRMLAFGVNPDVS